MQFWLQQVQSILGVTGDRRARELVKHIVNTDVSQGMATIGAVSSDGRTTVALSINSNVDDPVLAAEYRLIDHVMCNH